MAKVLIIGASKGIGLATVRQALDSGHSVRAMARSAEKIPISHDNLEKHNGDALDNADITAAVDGTEIVVQALGIAAGPRMLLGPITLFSRATHNLLPAMEESGIKRLISVTGFGAGDSYERIGCLQRVPFRLVLGQAYDDKSVQEGLIKDSDLEWTIVRPVILTHGRKTGRYRVLVEPWEWRNGLISRADVADFIVKQIDNNTLIRKAPVIAY